MDGGEEVFIIENKDQIKKKDRLVDGSKQKGRP